MVSFKATVLALGLASAANAYISGIVPRTKPFQVTDSSSLPVTFANNHGHGRDFTVVFGISPVSSPSQGEAVGDVVLGARNLLQKFKTPPVGNFDLHVKLTKEDVSNYAPGMFNIAAAVTFGTGADNNLELHLFKETIELKW